MEKLPLWKIKRRIEHETKCVFTLSLQLSLACFGSLKSDFCIFPLLQQCNRWRRISFLRNRRCQKSRPTGSIESARTTVRDGCFTGKILQRRRGAERSKSAKRLGTCNHRQWWRYCKRLHVHAVSGFRWRCSNRCIGDSPIWNHFQSMESARHTGWLRCGVAYFVYKRHTGRVAGVHGWMVACARWGPHGIYSA